MENILGKKAKDKVSGFHGIVTAQATYLDGTEQVEITSVNNAKANKTPESSWFHAGRVQIVKPTTARKSTKA